MGRVCSAMRSLALLSLCCAVVTLYSARSAAAAAIVPSQGNQLRVAAQVQLSRTPVPRYPSYGNGFQLTDMALSSKALYAILEERHAFQGGYDLQVANGTLHQLDPVTLEPMVAPVSLPYEKNLPQTGGYGYQLQVAASGTMAYICTQPTIQATNYPAQFTEVHLMHGDAVGRPASVGRSLTMAPVDPKVGTPSCSSYTLGNDGHAYFQITNDTNPFAAVYFQRLNLETFKFDQHLVTVPCSGIGSIAANAPASPAGVTFVCSGYTADEFLVYQLMSLVWPSFDKVSQSTEVADPIAFTFPLGNQTDGQLVPRTAMYWMPSGDLVWGCNGQFGDYYEPQAINVVAFSPSKGAVVRNVTAAGTQGQTLESLGLTDSGIAFFTTSKGLYDGTTWASQIYMGPPQHHYTAKTQQLPFPFNPTTNSSGVRTALSGAAYKDGFVADAAVGILRLAVQ